MAKNPDHPKKPGKTPKSKAPGSKASRPDVQPIGPALAELLNPAINRGESGIGSSTGLQPPPDNSRDRRSGGEAAAHRARASTRGTSEDVAKRDATVTHRDARTKRDDASSSPPPVRRSPRAKADGGEGLGVGGGAASSLAAILRRHPPPPTPPRRFAGGGEKTELARSRPPPRVPASPKRRSANSRRPITAPPRPSRRSIRSWQSSSASPPRRKTPRRWRGLPATRWRRSASPPRRMRWTP